MASGRKKRPWLTRRRAVMAAYALAALFVAIYRGAHKGPEGPSSPPYMRWQAGANADHREPWWGADKSQTPPRVGVVPPTPYPTAETVSPELGGRAAGGPRPYEGDIDLASIPYASPAGRFAPSTTVASPPAVMTPLPAVDSPAVDAGDIAASGAPQGEPERSPEVPGWLLPPVPASETSVSVGPMPQSPAPHGNEQPAAASQEQGDGGSTSKVANDGERAFLTGSKKRPADDRAAVLSSSPTGAMVAERAQAKVRQGYALAERGALFAARNELIEALRMIAEAKDEKHGAPRRTVALAAGLKALDEAQDFTPRGAQLGPELDVKVIVASHRTPMAKSAAAAGLMPQQLADMYYQYAAEQLGGAVAGEPAGSMALHALGKLYCQLGKLDPEKTPQADRRALALQRAAILAREDNYLAAHELGVLLAESGRYAEAETYLGQVATREPNPVVLRNLARVERKLGHEQAALADERQAKFLAGRSGATAGNVAWVPPQTFVQAGDTLGPSLESARKPSSPAQGPLASSPPGGKPDPPPVQNATRPPYFYMR